MMSSSPSPHGGGVRYVTIVHPTRPNPVNSLGSATRTHLRTELEAALSDPAVTSVVLIGHGTNFSAGADIAEFSTPSSNAVTSTPDVPSLVDLAKLLESSPKPVVAALRGAVLGGGAELALACHYRIADPSPAAKTALGLPECKIGLIPGAGGTQRLPRLVGIENALGIIVGGKTVRAEEAVAMGFIDGVVGQGGLLRNESLEECAARWAKYAEIAAPLCLDYGRASLRRVPGDNRADLVKYCDNFARKLPPKERGGEAVRAAVEAVKASFQCENFDEGMDKEEELFLDLLGNSAQGRALRHAFFAERAVGKPQLSSSSSAAAAAVPHASGDDDTPPSKAALALLKAPSKAAIGIIGAGTMGAGIALSFLKGGYKPVILVDNSQRGLQRGLATIQKLVAGDVKRGRMSPKKAEQLLAADNLRGTTSLQDLSQCALIVEAVFENFEVKRGVFTKLDNIARPDALLLSNTSTLDVDAIASSLSSNRRTLSAGMHFFSPAHVMKLVEIVKSSYTTPSTLRIIRGVTKRLQKVGVVVGNCDGFVGNRMLFPYTSEMVFVLQEGGASVEEVDRALTQFGMSMGPFAMSDLAGNDIGYNIRREKGLVDDPPDSGARGKGRSEGLRYTTLADEMVTQLGRIGQKAQKGWYDYNPQVGKGRKPLPSKEVAAFVAAHSQSSAAAAGGGGSTKLTLDADEIVKRLLYPLINEGFKILEEGIASHPDDIDVIYLYGYGFPAWRGGPMHYADDGGIEGGLAALLKTLEGYSQRYGGSEYYQPAALLKECVARGVGVREYYERGWHLEKKQGGRGDDDQRSKL